MNPEVKRRRDNVAASMAALLIAFACLIVLYLIGFSFANSLLIAFGVLALIGLGHYLLWGRALKQEVKRPPPDRRP